MREVKILRLGLILLILFTLGGCGSSEPRGEVRGQVTLAGEPIPEGTLLFYSPESGWGQETPIIDSQFALTLADGGVPLGTYQLAVLPAYVEAVDKNGEMIRQQKSLASLPSHASNPATSGLIVEIQADKNVLQLDLSHPPPRRSR